MLVAEQLGRAMAPAPVIEAQVAARLLARAGTGPGAAGLGAVLDGTSITTLAVRPSTGGSAALVPGGSICDAVISWDGSTLRLSEVTDEQRSAVANLAAAPLADLRVDGGAVLAEGDAAAATFDTAIDEWLVLTAAAVVGMAALALDLACEYAIERRAFGAAIGSFQGIAHPLADDATNIDGAQLLVRKAAWALQRGDARGRELAAMAFAFASETAGVGHLRRGAHPRRLRLHARVRRPAATTGGCVVGHGCGATRGPRTTGSPAIRYGGWALMDFEWGERAERIRGEVKAFLAEHLTARARGDDVPQRRLPRRRLRPGRSASVTGSSPVTAT